jgi:histidinol-phosphate/aromatic aminotransferase/cobyric acid decarboxylase-like protein
MSGIPRAGAHGGDGEAVARALGVDPSKVLDLSQSLNPFALDVAAFVARHRRHVDAIARYPDVQWATTAAAEVFGVDPNRLLLTNGGSDAIRLVAANLGGGVVSEPEFALHPRSPNGPRWRSNPHNPSGVLAGADERVDVWDEAFYPLATGEWTRGDHDTVVVGSLTKVFACPGLRIGYVLADDARRFAERQPAWPLNGVALSVLPVLLALAELDAWRLLIEHRREDLVALLEGHGLCVTAADAPWVLVKHAGLRAALAPHGIVVRDCTSFGMPDHVRIALPDEAGLDRLGEVLSCTVR